MHKINVFEKIRKSYTLGNFSFLLKGILDKQTFLFLQMKYCLLNLKIICHKIMFVIEKLKVNISFRVLDNESVSRIFVVIAYKF